MSKAHSVAKLYHLRELMGNLFKINLVDLSLNDTVMEMDEELLEILNKSKNFIQNKNAKLYFVYIPTYYRFKVRQWNTDDYKNYKSVIKIVENLEIPIIDINREVFSKHKDPLSLFAYRRNGHFTEKGYK